MDIDQESLDQRRGLFFVKPPTDSRTDNGPGCKRRCYGRSSGHYCWVEDETLNVRAVEGGVEDGPLEDILADARTVAVDLQRLEKGLGTRLLATGVIDYAAMGNNRASVRQWTWRDR